MSRDLLKDTQLCPHEQIRRWPKNIWYWSPQTRLETSPGLCKDIHQCHAYRTQTQTAVSCLKLHQWCESQKRKQTCHVNMTLHVLHQR